MYILDPVDKLKMINRIIQFGQIKMNIHYLYFCLLFSQHFLLKTFDLLSRFAIINSLPFNVLVEARVMNESKLSYVVISLCFAWDELRKSNRRNKFTLFMPDLDKLLFDIIEIIVLLLKPEFIYIVLFLHLII